MLIPPAFATGIEAGGGADGKAWLDALPVIISELCAEWDLIPGEPLMHGYLALVVPVRRGSSRYVLKLCRPAEDVAFEVSALTAWRGRGAVLPVSARPDLGALLLERLDPDRSLTALPVAAAAVVAARLLRRLAIDCPPELPSLARLAGEWPAGWSREWERLGRPVPRRLLDAAADACRQLGPDAGSLLIHSDLHYGNVLAGDREPWLAIDPKPFAGDPEFGVAPMLWNRRGESDGPARRLDVIVGEAGLDPARATGWTLVRTVHYWLWALGVGLTDDLVMCRSLSGWLAG